MSDSVHGLLQLVRRNRLLKPEQLNEIKVHWLPCVTDSQDLAARLVQSGWMTSYQIAQLLDGHDQSLQLGPYRPLGVLGEGALGTVYRARDLVRRRTVALKVLRPELRGNPEVLQQFWQEAAALTRLKHPAFVEGYDIEPGEARHYFAMECVDGIDLARLLQLAGPLPAAQACDYVRQAAVGLQYAFEQGLVHRDIKPSNLLVAFAGEQVRILDIGSARREWHGDGEAIVSTPGALMGTADYIAPEQTVDPDGADTRADIYSLGCTFYHLLTGRPPFPGSSLARKLLQHQQSPPPLLREARPELPEKLEAVVQRMLAKQPQDRYQTPALVAVALAPFCQDAAPRLELERFRPQGDATADTLPTTAPAGRAADTLAEVKLAAGPDQGPRPAAAFVERRASPRRKGNLIPVQVADSLGKDETVHGWVLDRSAGGLGLVLRAALEIGTVVKVRPERPGTPAPWVQVRVIHCRRESVRWRVGCQFVEQLGWDVRGLFG
jgi:serine/threonine protein kinase